MRALLAVVCLLLCSPLCAVPGWAQEDVPVSGDAHRIRLWTLEGSQPGPTLLILGGIHGDEPGGYLGADYLIGRLELTRGRLLLVPRSNLDAILAGRRGVDSDLNRQFGLGEDGHPVNRALEELIGRADALLNLHDGWGFYRETWENERRNPRRYGQSIVADAETWRRPDGGVIQLGAMARRVLEFVNPHIEREEWRFRFLNTHTGEPDSPYSALVRSATYFALEEHGIPAFGVETSKDLPSDETRVRHQLLIIKGFIREFGLLEDPAPGIRLTDPVLEYLFVRVNDEPLRALRPGEQLEVPKGARVRFEGTEANVDSGVVLDVHGAGISDDRGTTFTVERPLELRVLRDRTRLGTVRVVPVETIAEMAPVRTASLPAPRVSGPGALQFRAEVDGAPVEVENDQVLEVRPGSRIRLLDPRGPFQPLDLVLDLVGFPGGNPGSPQEDRGHSIDTGSQLLDRFSVLGRGEYYRVRAREAGRDRGGFFLRVHGPRLVAVWIEREGGDRARVGDNERLRVRYGETVTIRDVETTLPGNEDLVVNFKGFAGPRGAEDRGVAIRTDRDLLREWALDDRGLLYEIQVLHHDTLIGRVLVELTETLQEAGGT